MPATARSRPTTAKGAWHLAAALVGALLLSTAGTPADAIAQPPPTQDVEDCWGIELPDPDEVPGLEVRELDCLLVEVPLDHAEPDGEVIQIAAAIVRAVSDDPAEPVVVLGGGPGEQVVQLLAPLVALNPQAVVDRTVIDRDLVVIDQRGVGLSQPALDCPEVSAVDPFGPDAALAFAQLDDDRDEDNPYIAAYAACFARLSPEVDLSAFNTLQNVEDLEVLRQALVGDGQIALYGTSYGARLALRAAGAHPDSWSSVVLSSPLPGEVNWYEEIAANYQDTLNRLGEACAADATGCAAAFPTLLRDLDGAVERLERDPVEVALPMLPGQELALTLDGAVLANLIFSAFYGPARPIPARIDGFAQGREQAALLGLTSPGPRADEPPEGLLGSPVAQPDDEEIELLDLVSAGMQITFVCSEELAYADHERLAADAAASSRTVQAFASDIFFGALDPAICEIWDVPAADPETFAPVVSDTPALVVTGGFDQITPPAYGEQSLEGLPNGVVVEIPDQGHAPALAVGPCGALLISQFLANPAGPLDASCAEDRPVIFDTVLADAPALQVSRVSGPERYATAARLSGWTFDPGVGTVLLTTGANFPDSLAAGSVGGQLVAPVLLTRPDALPAVTAQELARLRPERLIVVGGTEAVTDRVALDAGLAAGAPAERISGPDRFATAAALSGAMLPDGAATAYLATGERFPDALTASALSGTEGAALLLTGRDLLPATIAAELTRLDVDEVVVVGGSDAISDSVLSQITALGLPVTRVFGRDRFATAAAVAQRFELGTGWAFIATGMDFPDALAGAPVAAARGPVLLTTRDHVPPATAEALGAPELSQVGIFGGTAVVSDETAQALSALVVPDDLGPDD